MKGGIFPSQGTAPISPLVSRRSFLCVLALASRTALDTPWQRLGKGGVAAHQVNVPVPLKARTGWFGQLPINRWLERTTPFARAKVASRNFLGRAATPPLPRSIQSCPAGQLHNRKEVGGTKTKNLSAYFLERGICPHQIIANWTLNSKVVHYPRINKQPRLRSCM